MISFSIGMWELMCSRPEAKVLLAGPTASGKTTVGELLKRGVQPKAPHIELENVVTPTIGMNVVRSQVGAVEMTVLDVGGTMRSLWPRYLQEDCDAVVFVFDAATPVVRRPGHHSSGTLFPSSAGSDGSLDPALEEARLALAQVMDKAPPDLLVILLGTHCNSLTPERRQLAESMLKAEVIRGRQRARDRYRRGAVDDDDADENEQAQEDKPNDRNGDRREDGESVGQGGHNSRTSDSSSGSSLSTRGGAVVPFADSDAGSAARKPMVGLAAVMGASARQTSYGQSLPGGVKFDKVSPRIEASALMPFASPAVGTTSTRQRIDVGSSGIANGGLRVVSFDGDSSSSLSKSGALVPAPSPYTVIDFTAGPAAASSSGHRTGAGARGFGGIINAAAAVAAQHSNELEDMDDADADSNFEASLLASSNPSGSTMLRRGASGGGIAGSSTGAGATITADGLIAPALSRPASSGLGLTAASSASGAPGTESKQKGPFKVKATPSASDRSRAKLMPRDYLGSSSSSSASYADMEPPRMVWVDAFLGEGDSAGASASGSTRHRPNPEAPGIIRDLFEWAASNI